MKKPNIDALWEKSHDHEIKKISDDHYIITSSSSGTIYDVAKNQNGNGFICNCIAGQADILCSHAVRVGKARANELGYNVWPLPDTIDKKAQGDKAKFFNLGHGVLFIAVRIEANASQR